MELEKITLGSGKLYVKKYTSAEGMPDLEDVAVDENHIGWISGGAELTYTPTVYEAKDDLKKVSKIITTEEVVTLKSGLMTWNGATLEVLCSTARVDTTTKAGHRIVKIGGVGIQKKTRYVILFVHEDEEDGTTMVAIVGYNKSGFTLTYAMDKETVVDAEFTAVPHDTDGTLVIFDEEDADLVEDEDEDDNVDAVNAEAGDQPVADIPVETASEESDAQTVADIPAEAEEATPATATATT